MDIGVAAEAYGGLPATVVARGREILRLHMAKKSANMDMVTPLASLVAACRAMDEPVDVKRLAGLLGVSARALDQTARRISNGINVKSQLKITPGSLCVRHGCASISELVNRVHDEYQVVAERLSRGQGANGGGVRLFDPNNPMFAAACLVACAKRAKLRVDRPKLLAEVSANPRAFDAIISSIESTCQQSLAGATGGASSSRGGARASSAGRSAAENGNETAKPPLVMTKAAQRAAILLERAMVERMSKDKAAEAKQAAKEATAAPKDVAVTAKEYKAWRERVLTLRKQMAMDRKTGAPCDNDLPEAIATTTQEEHMRIQDEPWKEIAQS